MARVRPASPDDLEMPNRAPTWGRVISWGLWDWGASGFHAVITTFVFSVYVAEMVAPKGGSRSGAQWVSLSMTAAGFVIAISAPVIGQRADRAGRRMRNLAIFTALTVLDMVLMFLVKADPAYLLLGLVLLGAGNVFSEFAGVSYHSMLKLVSTPRTVGRVSGIGWSLGYFGGIVLLALSYFVFIKPKVPFFGVSSDPGLPYRMVALLCAAWFALFGLPMFVAVRDPARVSGTPTVSVAESYRILGRDLRRLWQTQRTAVWFLGASALYRDGLAAIFTFGAILATSVYGLSPSDVLVFGIAANVVAALGAVTAGIIEDRVGPKAIIMTSLIALVSTAVVLLFVRGPGLFWIFGLILCLWVGPAQSSSRTYLTRLAPHGREQELFGLYTTTGRAVSFLAPALFGVFAALGGDRVGIIGIAVVLLAGLVALLFVRRPQSHGVGSLEPAASTETALAMEQSAPGWR